MLLGHKVDDAHALRGQRIEHGNRETKSNQRAPVQILPKRRCQIRERMSRVSPELRLEIKVFQFHYVEMHCIAARNCRISGAVPRPYNTRTRNMPLEVITVPCLSDNYAFVFRSAESGETALVDAPEAKPIIAALAERGWGLDWILLTHHHADHIDGAEELRKRYGAKVVGNAADSRRLPKLDVSVSDGDTLTVCGERFRILDASGHTIGHIAFVAEGHAFTADSLMALGCGRVFEGTHEMMWNSLQKLAALDPDTIIYSGHEYTESNARFALSVEPENDALIARSEEIKKLRKSGKPTVPSKLADELRTNPFLRARLPEIKLLINMPDASDAEAFAEIRTRKDNF